MGTSTVSGTRPAPQGGLLGQRYGHHDFVDKVAGKLRYADDWSLPGMLYGRVVRSDRPSARIVRVNLDEASAVPGVVALLTAEDVPVNEIIEASPSPQAATVKTPVLASGQVRYNGEPVAVVAALSPDAAEEAAELVDVQYEDLPAVLDAEEALERGSPIVHARAELEPRSRDASSVGWRFDGGAEDAAPSFATESARSAGVGETNLLAEWRFERGDVEQALAGADVVLEDVYRTHRVDHAYLETEAGVGWVEDDGTITLRVSTQVIEHTKEIAALLARPESKIRIIGTYMGGGFGGKEDMTVEPYLALLVWATERPVKMVWSRQESLLASSKRHPMTLRYRTGARSDGTILAQDIDIVADAGAYPTLSTRVSFAAGVVAPGPYRIPTVRIRSKAVLTNNVPSGAFRGFGAMQVVLAHEAQMDKLAAATGVSKTDVRLRNYLQEGDQLPTGEIVPTTVALPETTQRVLDALGPRQRQDAGPLRYGWGIASNMQPYGRARFYPDQASCWMSLQSDGSLVIRSGVPDLGGGQAASLCLIAGEILGIPLDSITVKIADTHLTPSAGGTFATRQLYMSGNAALATATELREKLATVASGILGCDADDLVFADRRIRCEGRSLTLAEVAKECAERGVTPGAVGHFQPERGVFDPKTGRGDTFPDYTYGTHGCEVEVNIATGAVRILDYVACHDVGVALNPTRVEGQIQGGVVQGIGYALSEQVPAAGSATGSNLFADYLIPAASDLPDVRAQYLESGEGKGPFHARGIGEPPIGPPAAAIASAIEDAIGIRVTTLPITPDRVLSLLEANDRPRVEQRTSDPEIP